MAWPCFDLAGKSPSTISAIMSLVTRCPACGTMFKVVADQLRVSQGWVRCGSCSDVFDAGMHFQSVPLPVSDDEAQIAQHAGGVPVVAAFEPTTAGVADGVIQPTSPLNPASGPAHQTEPVDDVERPYAAEINHLVLRDVAAPESQPESADLVAVQPDFKDVSFVRMAHKKAVWKTPLVRVSLAVLAGALVVLLALQWAVQHRDQIAVTEPRMVAALQAVCRPLGCRISPLRRIESLVIDSASFTKVDGRNFRLSFVLKNTSDTPLEAPLLELTLSDSQDKTVLRRVLSPAQFGFRGDAVLAVRSETSGLVNLAVVPDESGENPVSSAVVAGYRVLVFYP
jgi:predicted Zn finger-like uncharacterized protein